MNNKITSNQTINNHVALGTLSIDRNGHVSIQSILNYLPFFHFETKIKSEQKSTKQTIIVPSFVAAYFGRFALFVVVFVFVRPFIFFCI